MFNNLFLNRAFYEIMWKYIVESDRPQMTIWCKRIAYCTRKTTNRHSEYTILLPLHHNNGYTNTPEFYVRRNLLFCCCEANVLTIQGKYSANIIWVIKRWSFKLAVNLVCTGEKSTYRILTWNHVERDHLQYLGLDGTLIWKQLSQQTVGHALEWSSLRQGFCEFDNEPSGYIILISFANCILKECFLFPASHRTTW